MSTIGKNIAILRKKKGITQEALAALIGVSMQSVSKWETDTNMPDVMLLPVIADAFGVTIDALYDRGGSYASISADEVLDMGCHALLKTIGQSIWEKGRDDFEFSKSFDEHMKAYEQALGENADMRTAVLRRQGAVYYREPLGGLLLKRPQDGWASLLNGDDADEVCRLLGNAALRKALHYMIRSHTTVFTIPSLCQNCGIENQEAFKALLDSVDWFTVKTVDLGDNEVTVYELERGSRIFVLLAILALCREYTTYRDIYFNYNGSSTFYME